MRQERIELGKNAFWGVINDPNHIQRNNENTQNALHRFGLLRNDIEFI